MSGDTPNPTPRGRRKGTPLLYTKEPDKPCERVYGFFVVARTHLMSEIPLTGLFERFSRDLAMLFESIFLP
jgi:hypothetical protein